MHSTAGRTDFSHFASEMQGRRQVLREEIHQTLLRSREEGHARLAGEVRDRKDESLADLLTGISIAEIQRDAGEIRDIDAALERIKLGTYGVCIDCGAEIARERLQAYPTAKRCTNCQRRHETKRKSGPVPKL